MAYDHGTHQYDSYDHLRHPEARAFHHSQKVAHKNSIFVRQRNYARHLIFSQLLQERSAGGQYTGPQDAVAPNVGYMSGYDYTMDQGVDGSQPPIIESAPPPDDLEVARAYAAADAALIGCQRKDAAHQPTFCTKYDDDSISDPYYGSQQEYYVNVQGSSAARFSGRVIGN